MDAHEFSNTALAGCAGRALVRNSVRWHFANGRTNYGSSSNNVDVNVDIDNEFGDVVDLALG
jgi:hypothetical protein